MHPEENHEHQSKVTVGSLANSLVRLLRILTFLEEAGQCFCCHIPTGVAQ